MTTSFTLSHDSKVFELFAERVSVGEDIETWRVQSRTDTNSFLTVTNNRPLLHRQHSYKAFFKWTVLEGDYTLRRITMLVTHHLDYYIKGQWKPPTKGVNEKKAAAAKQQGKLF